MSRDISTWDQDDDPLTREQVDVLLRVLDGKISDKALEGFLIVAGRFVDSVGAHRTEALVDIFRTHTSSGKAALHASLEYVCEWNGGLETYTRRFPVSIGPARPAFPLFKVMNISNITSRLYRAIDSRSTIGATGEAVGLFIERTGRLPPVPLQRAPVRRSKPRFHWCSYDAFLDPAATQSGLQILADWSDCRLRATLAAADVEAKAYVAFNGDRFDPEDSKLRFYNYFFEPLASDHPPMRGGGVQVGVEGRPRVEALEEWDERKDAWVLRWSRSRTDSRPWCSESADGAIGHLLSGR